VGSAGGGEGGCGPGGGAGALSAAELGQQVEYLQAELGGLLEERYQLQVNRGCGAVLGFGSTL
jgi:hypothetical protein